MLTRVLLAVAALIGIVPSASGHSYPSRPITIVVPFPPGGGLDFVPRTIQSKWKVTLDQPMRSPMWQP
jgi:tripartite-type tricarboxylate transporter receptor subunit TctC